MQRDYGDGGGHEGVLKEICMRDPTCVKEMGSLCLTFGEIRHPACRLALDGTAIASVSEEFISEPKGGVKSRNRVVCVFRRVDKSHQKPKVSSHFHIWF